MGKGLRAWAEQNPAFEGAGDMLERLAVAVANVHARTGAPICTHAHAPGKRGLDQQRVLAAHGADLGKVMIGHSNESTDLGYLEKIIENGSYLGWDRCGLPVAVPLDTQIDTLAALVGRGYANRIMLAHDKSSFMDWFTAADYASDELARFPAELQARWPPKRRPWMSEDPRMDLFDAVGLARVFWPSNP